MQFLSLLPAHLLTSLAIVTDAELLRLGQLKGAEIYV